MIKIDKEKFKIETDCRTVGEFMTEAAAFGVDRLVIKVDGCRYEFFDNPKIRVTDDTPIGLVFIDGIGTGGTTPDMVLITVLTKPKPKTVRKSGWVNVYKSSSGDYCVIGKMYGKESECQSDQSRREFIVNAEFVSTAKIEWDEVFG